MSKSQGQVAFAAFDNCCEYAWRTFAEAYPVEMSMWNKYMSDIRARSETNKAWSEGKLFKHVGEIPSYVYGIVDMYFKGFMNDKSLRDRFFNKHAFCRVNESTNFAGTKGRDTGVEIVEDLQ